MQEYASSRGRSSKAPGRCRGRQRGGRLTPSEVGEATRPSLPRITPPATWHPPSGPTRDRFVGRRSKGIHSFNGGPFVHSALHAPSKSRVGMARQDTGARGAGIGAGRVWEAVLCRDAVGFDVERLPASAASEAAFWGGSDRDAGASVIENPAKAQVLADVSRFARLGARRSVATAARSDGAKRPCDACLAGPGARTHSVYPHFRRERRSWPEAEEQGATVPDDSNARGEGAQHAFLPPQIGDPPFLLVGLVVRRGAPFASDCKRDWCPHAPSQRRLLQTQPQPRAGLDGAVGTAMLPLLREPQRLMMAEPVRSSPRRGRPCPRGPRGPHGPPHRTSASRSGRGTCGVRCASAEPGRCRPTSTS